ncbi:MAG TPA: AMP-binding protein, partial [Roseiflexaceae bacterium]|nr:AMP-binding protein [Roseiflexaceae bacterium]
DASLRQHACETATTFVLGYRWQGRQRLGGKLDYWRLCRHIERFANALYLLGVRKGDRVALALPSSPQYVIAFFGAVQLGAIVVNCNPAAPADETAYRLADSGAETIVLLDTLWPLLRPIRHATALKRVVVARLDDTLPWLDRQLLSSSPHPTLRSADVPWGDDISFFSEMLRFQAPPSPPIAIAPSDPALLQYTGSPDAWLPAITLTHANLVINALQCLEALFHGANLYDRERVLSAVPFHEIYGLQAGMLCPMALGAELVIVPEPHSVEQILAAAQHEHVTRYCATPAHYRTLVDQHQMCLDQLDAVMAWYSGPTPLPADVQERFQLLTQRRIIAGFGLTECGPFTHGAALDGPAKPGSIGRLLPATAGRLVDPISGADLRFDGRDQGELLIRGPQVTPGYWQRPAMTARALDADGWLHTGLRCAADGDGDFFITGVVAATPGTLCWREAEAFGQRRQRPEAAIESDGPSLATSDQTYTRGVRL